MNKVIYFVEAMIILFLRSNPSFAQIWTEFLGGIDVVAIRWDDKRELLWYATSGDGVLSFDGTKFTEFNAITTNQEIITDLLTSAAIDLDGDLWFGTIGKGLIRFQPDLNKWQTYSIENGLLPGRINALSVAPDGSILVGTDGNGVNLFDRISNWDTLTVEDGLSSNLVLTIEVDDSSNIWFGTAPLEDNPGGVSMLDRSGAWQHYLPQDIVNAIFVEKLGEDLSVWFGTQNGAYHLISKDGQFDPRPRENSPLEGLNINAIIADEDGSKWLGFDFGAARLDLSEPDSIWKVFTDITTLNFRKVKTIALDDEGNLWFGSDFLEQGAVRLNSNWKTFLEEDGLSSNTVSALAEDQSGTIWAGTVFGLSKLNSTYWESFLYGATINAIAVDSENGLWLGTSGEGLIHVPPGISPDDPEQTITYTDSISAANFITDIEVKGEEIWFGTQAGLKRLQPKTGLLERFDVINTNGGLIDNRVGALAFEDDSILWCGTVVGVSRFDINSNTWENFTVADGLPDNWITDILVGTETGEIWFATKNRGVGIYFAGIWQKPITIADGLADNRVNKILELENPKGMLFGTANGASFLDANNIFSKFTTQHGLRNNFVSTLLVDQKNNIWFGTFFGGVTHYKRKTNRPNTRLLNNFDVTTSTEVLYNFIGADHGTPTALLRYAYKLDNGDYSPWTFDTFANVRVSSNGLHTFYVKTIDSDGNEDHWPATDSFYKIDPDTGVTTTFIDTSGSFLRGDISLRLYWPPHQLPDTTQVTILPVPPDSLEDTAVLAYDIKPFGLDIREKGVILSFAVPESLLDPDVQYSIHRDKPDTEILGGTITIKPDTTVGGNGATQQDTIVITTSIEQLGRYAVHITGATSQEASVIEPTRVNAQPRIFSPRGGGHGTETTLSFTLPQSAHVRINVYNLAGRLVNTICNRPLNAGVNAIAWDGRDKNGQICQSGLYIMTIASSVLNDTKTVMVLNH